VTELDLTYSIFDDTSKGLLQEAWQHGSGL